MNSFAQRLLQWFDDKGRKDLPWQQNKTAYRVWVSEIMLQQTTVGAVLQNRRFERFLSTFPDLASLASATEEELLRAWEGLGYYNRVRNLQKTARAVLEEYGGEFPTDPVLLETLPGVGRYTAGAVATFAFDRSAPIVDANVARVLTRLFDYRKPIITNFPPLKIPLHPWRAKLTQSCHVLCQHRPGTGIGDAILFISSDEPVLKAMRFYMKHGREKNGEGGRLA